MQNWVFSSVTFSYIKNLSFCWVEFVDYFCYFFLIRRLAFISNELRKIKFNWNAVDKKFIERRIAFVPLKAFFKTNCNDRSGVGNSKKKRRKKRVLKVLNVVF
jgi:hypothetical protein